MMRLLFLYCLLFWLVLPLNYTITIQAKKYKPILPVIIKQTQPVINITKIGLNEKIYLGNKNNNNLKHIILASYSNSIHHKNANIILMAHSGNGKYSYFKNIHLLSVGDYVYIYQNDLKYTFQIIYKRKIMPTNTAALKHQNYTTLTLVTCFKHYQRLLIVAKLKGVNYH